MYTKETGHPKVLSSKNFAPLLEFPLDPQSKAKIIGTAKIGLNPQHRT